MQYFPSFPFYAADWLADEKVQVMSMSGEGAYIHLLAICWREGSIPADRSAIVQLCKGQDGSAIDEALLCFRPVPRKPGRLINKRLEEERRKLENFHKSKKLAGLHGAAKRWHSHAPAIVLPLAKDASSSSSSLRDKNKSYLFLSDLLAERVRINVPFQKIPGNYQDSWANEFRLMVETDKIPIERVKSVLDWATSDSFWKINIRSASKFREKFGALEAKSRFTGISDVVARERRVGASKTPASPKADAEIKAVYERILSEYEPKIEAAEKSGDRKEVTRLRGEAQAKFDGEAVAIWKKTGEARP